MRLYNTLTRQLEELPEPPGPVRMYFCGPTVYQRAHIGNARPFVVGMWLRAWLRARGYDATLVHNITDVNDKIYDAAPGASAELAADATAVVPRGHRRPRARDAGRAAEGDRARPGDRPLHRAAGRVRATRIAVEGDVYFRVASDPGVRAALRPAARPDGGAGAEPAEGGSARLRALEGEQAGRGHVVGLAVGQRPPGLAHRVLGDGGGGVRAGRSRSTAAGSTSSSRTTRTSSRSRARSATSSRSIWMHNGMLEFGGEKMSKSLGNDVSIRNVLDTWGREVVLLFFMTAHWRKPIDFTDETLAAGEGAGGELQGTASSDADRRRSPRSGSVRGVLDDDFNTPEALALMHDWRSRGLQSTCSRGLAIFGLDSLAVQAQAPDDVDRARRGAAAGARGEGLCGGRPASRRDRARTAGTSGTWPAASSSCRGVTREQVYGRRPVREALRGRREVLELWATERAVKAEAWLRELERPRVQVKLDRDISEAAGTRDHQGVLAWCEPYHYADAYELAATRAAAPRVPRPGQRPAQPRRGLPQRGGRGRDRRRRAVPRLRACDRRRLPRVRRRRRAPAGRRRHEPRALPRGDQERRPLGRGRRRRVRDADVAGRPLGRARVRLRRRGERAAPARPPHVRPRGRRSRSSARSSR